MSTEVTTPSDNARSGNTNAERSSNRHSPRNKSWFVTTFNEKHKEIVPEKTKYFISCEDTSKPEHGSKWHMHILLFYPNAISFNTVQRLYYGAHIEKPNNVNDCIAYIKNNINGRKFNIIERGDQPHDSRFMSVGELKKIENPDELDWKMFNTWNKLKCQPKKIKISEWHKDVNVIWITGSSGSGKSMHAGQLICEHGFDEIEEVKHVGEFWQGVVDGTGACIYDDFRDSDMKASEFINFIDYNVHNLNVKGGNVKNQYKLIVITSIQHPETIYRNMTGEPRMQWMRRIKIIDQDLENVQDP